MSEINEIEEVEVQGTTYGINTTKLSTKAEIDGAYEQMTVGNAEQLVSNSYETDKAPYLFRTTGGSLEVGNRAFPTLVGASGVVNQLMSASSSISTYTKAGLTLTRVTGANGWTVSGTYDKSVGDENFYVYNGSPINLIKDHKYLVYTNSKYFKAYTYSALENKLGQAVIAKANSNGTNGFTLNANSIPANTAINETVYLNVIDLTAYFGSNTIPDRAYALEQSVAGSGIAWLKSFGFFTKPYYAYNTGTMQSVKVSKYKSVGFNQWDEEWEVGGLDSTGAKTSASNRIRTKNYIPVLPNTQYYFQAPLGYNADVYEYSDKDAFPRLSIQYKGGSSNIANNQFTTGASTHYLMFVMPVAYGTTYNHDICINLHYDGSRDGEYEQYNAHEYAVEDVELRGLYKLDANNNIYADGDVYESDGTVTRKYESVNLGSLDWSATATNTEGKYRMRGTLTTSAKVPSANNVKANMVCASYDTITAVDTNALTKGISIDISGYIRVYDSSYDTSSSASAFKTAMNGVYLVYELATPTDLTADPYQTPMVCDNWGPEEWVDTRTVPMPVGNETNYPPNLTEKLIEAPNAPTTDGDYLMRRSGGENAYVQFTKELPTLPSEDGTYLLKCTVSGSTKTLAWVEEE